MLVGNIDDQYCADTQLDVSASTNQAMNFLPHPDKMSMLVDPEIKNVKIEDLSVLCGVISLCIDPEKSRRPSMQILCAMLEDGIDTSVGAIFRDSALAWSELAF